MSKAMDEARRRFVEIDALHERNRADDNLWKVWQTAGVDYWLMQHPELRHYRGLDPNRPLSRNEIVELAELINHAMDGIPATWRIDKWDRVRADRSAQVAWWHELMGALYTPTYNALQRARAGERSSIETLVNFLQADPFCHRSGYVKADIIKLLTRFELDDSTRRRLREVLFAAIGKPTRREFRRYIRLARYLDDESLRADMAALAADRSQPRARHAAWILEELERP